MGKQSRLKRARREERMRYRLPPCSNQKCAKGRPPGEYLVKKKDGNFFTACEDCLDPMVNALRLEGVDAEVIKAEGLRELSDAAARRHSATNAKKLSVPVTNSASNLPAPG